MSLFNFDNNNRIRINNLLNNNIFNTCYRIKIYNLLNNNKFNYMRNKKLDYKKFREIYYKKIKKYTNELPTLIQKFYDKYNNQKFCLVVIIYICIIKKYLSASICNHSQNLLLGYNKFKILNREKCIKKFSKLFSNTKDINIWKPNNRGYMTCNEKIQKLNLCLNKTISDKWYSFWSGETDLLYN
jgi:hypothetical protein